MSETCLQAVRGLAAELLGRLDACDSAWEWQVPFLLARRLMAYGDGPEEFEAEIEAFCEATGDAGSLDPPDMLAAVAAVWDKVRCPEGEDFFSAAAEAADRHPVGTDWPKYGGTFGAVAGLAYHMARARAAAGESPRFALPQERIARWLSVPQVRVSRTVTLLERVKVIARVQEGSYTRRQAAEYVLTAAVVRRGRGVLLGDPARRQEGQ